MIQEPRVVSFTVNDPFDDALRVLRRALAREGLRVTCEVNTSKRLRSELGVTLRDNIILFVDDPILLLEATVFTPAGTLYIPEPVVLSASGKESRVVVRSIKPLLDESLPTSVRHAILTLHERILKAIQAVGQREAVFPHEHRIEPVPA
jgi:uncharacterized protein (DUF302 family)